MTAESDPDNASFAPLGLTYDDVLLLPGETDVIPSEVDTTTRLTREISIRIPLISAAMDTVTESRMAINMARQGGIGVLHRNLSIDDQAYQVDVVKRTQTGMISNPITIGPDATLEDLDTVCGQYRVSGLPVVDPTNHLIGIITNRDLRFTPVAEWGTTLVRDVMTPMPLITAPEGISREDATLLLRQHKRERLPLIDGEGRLAGLITVKDMMKSTELTAVVVFGGLGSMSGCLLGTAVITLVTELFRPISQFRMLIYGAVLVIIMVLRPEGIMGNRELLSWIKDPFGRRSK